MSLRWRLTLWYTLVLTVVLALLSALAFVGVKAALYGTIDKTLDRHTTASLLYLLGRNPREFVEMRSEDALGVVSYMVFNSEGGVELAQRDLPVNTDTIQRALGGETVISTQTLLDGRNVRVLARPIPSLSTDQVVGVLQAATPLEITDETLENLTAYIVLACGMMLVVAGIGSYILTGRTLREVEGIRRKVQQIELSQDLSQRIADPGTRDELAHLVQTFNRMLARLEGAWAAQRRFVADSSHELRTPLTVIRSNLHLLRRTTEPSEEAALLAITEAEVSRLNGMINDLLYMAQMHAGHESKPVMRPVELDSLLLDIFSLGRSLAALKNQKVVLVHEDIAMTEGDREQLQHALLNLVDNAVKYTPEGGTIALGLWSDGDWARIEVTDDGPGIPADNVPLIFERFYRAPEARRSERNGSGLGLAIVKSIIEGHGGRVEVESRPGDGTTFKILLPSLSSVPQVGAGSSEAPAVKGTPQQDQKMAVTAATPKS